MTPLRSLAILTFCLVVSPLFGQPTPAAGQPTPPPVPPMPTSPAPAPVDPNAVAATVNGENILEMAVQRGLEGVLPAKRAEARPEVLNFLVDNLLIDQYLKQANIQATPQEVEGRLNEMKVELQKRKLDLEQMLKNLKLTEAELRHHISADLRWERFLTTQATDEALKKMFTTSKEMFDDTTLRARHILLAPATGDGPAVEAAVNALRTYKKQVESQATEALKKVPAEAEALTRERARTQAVEEAFMAIAKEKSTCPSKDRGGDLGWFQRVGFMVEPFASAAFALKPFEMSDVVKTPYGYHLILTLDRKPGREVQFEQVKERVRDVFADRLRESMVAQLRPKAKIAIAPMK